MLSYAVSCIIYMMIHLVIVQQVKKWIPEGKMKRWLSNGSGRPDSGWSDDTILPNGCPDWISGAVNGQCKSPMGWETRFCMEWWYNFTRWMYRPDFVSSPWVTTTYRRSVCVLVHWTLHLIWYYLFLLHFSRLITLLDISFFFFWLRLFEYTCFLLISSYFCELWLSC